MKFKQIATLMGVGVFSAVMAVIGMKYFESPREIVVKQEVSQLPLRSVSTTASTLDFTDVARNSVDAVVHVKTSFMNQQQYVNPLYEFFFGPQASRPQEKQLGTGSGVIVSNDGYIVTNNHVVDKANMIKIVLNDKREFDAKLIGTDPTTDIALLKIEGSDFPFLSFGDSDDLNVGEWVVAIGNPFNLNSTVTAGIVSAKARNINILSSQYSIESFIQTDAAVNPGNSGGALINTAGKLIGINTAIASPTGSFSGYSFAVPANIAKKIVADLTEFGQVQRALIGVMVMPIDQKLAEKLELDAIKGVLVSDFSDNSAAKDAGMKVGDVILEIQGHTINSFPELQEQVSKFRPGDEIVITVQRGSKEKKIKVVLRNKYGSTEIVERGQLQIEGAVLNEVESNVLLNLNLRNGVQVSELTSGPLKKAGIKEGFLITHINKHPVGSPDDVYSILKRIKGAVYIDGVYPNGIAASYGFYR